IKMNLSNSNDFITATQMYRENNDCFNASFTSSTSVDSIDSSDGILDNNYICENESETSDK
ncbi:3822_t:CDS:1, partial [Dentiscutata erythropus]